MSKYRFVGTESIIAGHHVETFGAVLELDTDLAEQLRAQHPPALIITETDWEDTGITDAECREFPSVLMHDTASAGFLAKRNKAWTAMHEHRASVTVAKEQEK